MLNRCMHRSQGLLVSIAFAVVTQVAAAHPDEPLPKGVSDALKREAESLETQDEAVIRQRWGVWADLVGTSWAWTAGGQQTRWLEFRWWIPGAAVRYTSITCRDRTCEVGNGVALYSPKDSEPGWANLNPRGESMFNIYWDHHDYVHAGRVKTDGVLVGGGLGQAYVLEPSSRVLRVDATSFEPSNRKELAAWTGVNLPPTREELALEAEAAEQRKQDQARATAKAADEPRARQEPAATKAGEEQLAREPKLKEEQRATASEADRQGPPSTSQRSPQQAQASTPNAQTAPHVVLRESQMQIPARQAPAATALIQQTQQREPSRANPANSASEAPRSAQQDAAAKKEAARQSAAERKEREDAAQRERQEQQEEARRERAEAKTREAEAKAQEARRITEARSTVKARTAEPSLTIDDSYAKEQAKFRKEHEERIQAAAKRDEEAKAKSAAATAAAAAQAQSEREAAVRKAKAKATPCPSRTCASKQ
jgi:hypothetical protein